MQTLFHLWQFVRWLAEKIFAQLLICHRSYLWRQR